MTIEQIIGQAIVEALLGGRTTPPLPPPPPAVGKFCIVRCQKAGVHAGGRCELVSPPSRGS